MSQLGGITHPSPLIDKKVKYFYDCFHYWLSRATNRIDGFPENHMTYLERMAFRGNTLKRMHQSTREPIVYWLSQIEFNVNHDELMREEPARSLVIHIKEVASKTKNDFDLVLFSKLVQELIVQLNGSRGISGTEYFRNVLHSVVSCLGCEHDLKKHQDEIAINTKWLVAEFLRFGFDPEELARYDGVFSRILSLRELRFSKSPKHTNFPLPFDLRQKMGKRGFKKAFHDFLGEAIFMKQFEGLLYALQEEQTGTLLFRIDGVRYNDKSPFHFEYGGVKIMAFEQLVLTREGWDKQLSSTFDEFFNAPNTLIALVPMRILSKKQAYIKARQLVIRSLHALRYLLGEKGGALVQPRRVILYANGGLSFSFVSDEWLTLHEADTKQLKDFNHTIPIPENLTPEIQDYLERCDRIFFKGLSADDPDDMIACFWQYWETSFDFPAYQGPQKGAHIIRDLRKVLAENIGRKIRIELSFMLYNYAINNVGEMTGITMDIYQNQFNKEEPEVLVNYIASFTKYPFLCLLIERFRAIDNTTEELRWERFYGNLLWELYEQRNLIVHQGIYCASTLDRLQLYLQAIVSRWRAILFNKLEQNIYTTPEELIRDLVRT